MTYLLIDNTNDIDSAKMTPLIIEYFKKHNYPLEIISNKKNIYMNTSIKGIILSGGPDRLTDKLDINDIITNINAIIRSPHIPILGICFGYQIIAISYGGNITKLKNKKMGIKETINIINNQSILYKNIDNKKISVYQFHNDYIDKVPHDFNITSIDDDNKPQSIENIKLLRFGTQFHPEASDHGDIILKNFIDFCEQINHKSLL